MSGRALRLLFVGPPGVGKGTYAARVAQERQCTHISSGDLLRAEVKQQTAVGKEIAQLLNTGELVPDALIAKMIASYIAAHPNPHGYILDGYPRTLAQAKSLWEEAASGTGGIQIDHVVNLTQPFNVIVAKLSSRRSCADCGFGYNFASIDEGGIKMQPLVPKVEGVCDKCGSRKPLLTRDDDKADVVAKRLNLFDKTARPLLDFYREKNVLVDFPVLGGAKQFTPKLLELLDSLPATVRRSHY